MGIINLFKGLDLQKEIYNFNGSIKENLELNWDYVKIYEGEKELDPDYQVQEDDIIIVQEFPAGTGTGNQGLDIFLGIITFGIYTSVVAYNVAQEAQKDMKNALNRIGKDNKQKEVSSIPGLSGAKNERADGKNAPVIIGRHSFTPYFLSEPYMRPEGIDGKDLYWYGTFLAGQNGLCFENKRAKENNPSGIRNGMNELVTNFAENASGDNFKDNEAQYGQFFFDKLSDYESNPNRYDPAHPDYDPPPFYDPENFIEIVQRDYSFTEERFEQKWVDSLNSTVELGREKLDGAGTVYDSTLRADVINDKGGDPIIRETARFPMGAEIEIFIDGLHGWDSQNGVETNATVGVKIEWSTSADGGWENIPILWKEESLPRVTYPASSISTSDLRIRLAARFGQTVSNNMTFHLQTGGSIGGQEITDIAVHPSSQFYILYMYFLNKNTVVHEQPLYSSLSKELIINSYESSESGSATITRAKAEQMRFLATVDFPARIFSKEGKPVFIRAARTTKMYSGSYRDRVYLSAIRTKQYNPKKLPAENYNRLTAAKNLNDRLKNKFCRIGIKIKANKNTQEALDRFNIVASMTAKTWDGQKWSEEKTKTSNPGAIALEILTGLIHEPSKYNDSEINPASFVKLYEYCQNREVKITGEGTVKFDIEANGVLTSGTKKLDILKSVLAVCDAGLYVDEFGKFHVYYDDRQSAPIALLNPQRIVKINEQRSLERKTDGYTVEFVNQETDWSTDTHRILRPRVEESPGLTTYTSIKLDYTTNYYQAMWHARRMMAKEIYRRGELKITVGKEGRYYTPGSLIKVQHEGLKKGLGSGEITQVIYSGDGKSINGFKLMEKFDIARGRDYFIEYFVVKGGAKPHVIYPIEGRKMRIQSVGEYTDTLTLAIPLPADDYNTPDTGNILSVNLSEYERYVVSDLSENADGYDLTLFPYSDEIYNVDDIPAYQSSIINAPPRVYSNYERMPIDGEGGQGMLTVQNLDQTVSPVIANRTAGYRGVLTVIDDDVYNGIVNGDVMNINDWVAYKGELSGEWIPFHCYRWTGTEWERIDIAESEPYMAALADIVEDAPEGRFSQILAGNIMALQASIDVLRSKEIILKELKDKNGKTVLDDKGNPIGGIIQSENWAGVNAGKGWFIDYYGNAYFNSGKIGGITIAFDTITAEGGRTPAPVGMIYFQLPGKPEPGTIFTGKWEDISDEYKGLFFRVEDKAGGTTALFDNIKENSIQGQSIQSHNHGYDRMEYKSSGGNIAPGITMVNTSRDTSSTGGNETRPRNITIRVWEKKPD